MSPEAVLSLEYSTASDIWSTGVTFWEIFNFGRQAPFQLYSNAQVVDLIVAGRLLDCPSYCEPSLYALMLDCWREIPAQRCSFSELVQKLSQLINNCKNTLQTTSSHNNWLSNNSVRNNNRVFSPMPSQNHRTNVKQQIPYGEEKVNGWLLNANTEFNGSSNYLANNVSSKNTALRTNTMNSSSSTYASSYCNNQSSSPNYNHVTNSTANQNVEYDQPFVQINDLESSHKLIKQSSNQPPTLSTFQSSKPRNGLTVGLKHLELKNSHLMNYKLDKQDDYQENHYSKLTYENDETESMLSSSFGLI